MCPHDNPPVSSPPPPISVPEKTSADGLTPSVIGTPGVPSPSALQVLRDLASKLMVGPEAAPVLTGPLTITGSGRPDWGEDVHPLRSLRSKKVGEEGYTFTLYLDQATRKSLAKRCGEAGSLDTVAVSFGVSIPILEPFTT